ncbi:TetR/AcrR family transcriptional regulator [Gordonia sp. HY002]|uniref:TetR/AcrR family transcriptional regulator n=1 Tax=Gordonia zhenghanii TaxID=2911516 RepID=UPI001EF106D9|nr:TetR/AcrR family transcriptional regulator [Gordonia zhenghanii]MCF8571988.1 TetR/AcrR family transcriptional regulator [Gordonia zhenghanii]MCF8604206.1 TetR/AcrR family transcriptional regulator [Gordonia zhenghanii]
MSQQLNGSESPVRRQASNAISEDTILDAATRLMSTIGIRRTTMADVARSADVSRATLYRRYPNVESLAAQITTREFTRIAAQAPVTDEPATRRTMIITLVHLVREARAHPLLQRIVELDPEFLMPYLLHRTGRTSRSQLEMIETMIGRGQSSGQIRDGDPHRIATTVLQMAWSFALTGPVFADPDNDHELDDELSDLLERYLRP